MAVNVFFSKQIDKGIALLDENESFHCLKVLRMKRGDVAHLIDGKGGYHIGIIKTDNPRACELTIEQSYEEFEKRNYSLHLAIAPTKNIDRFEWFVEKATEIGIDKITPVICEHSERKTLRIDRLEKITLSAVKQSLKAYIPEINSPVNFNDFIVGKHSSTSNFIAHCAEGIKPYLIQNTSKSCDYLVLIGPEGDFSESEIRLAQKSGFQPVSLGQSRLRTETAGVVATQIIADVEMLRQKKIIQE